MSASALRVLLRFLYMGELPAWGNGKVAEGQVGPMGVAGREDGGARAARAAKRRAAYRGQRQGGQRQGGRQRGGRPRGRNTRERGVGPAAGGVPVPGAAASTGPKHAGPACYSSDAAMQRVAACCSVLQRVAAMDTARCSDASTTSSVSARPNSVTRARRPRSSSASREGD